MIKTVVRYFLKPKDGRSPYIGENGNWFEWDDPQQKYIDTGRPARGETGKDGTNYLILGWWDDKISYMLSDLGIPVVKVPDSTSLEFSVYELEANYSTIGTSPAGSSEWKLVESSEFIYMQDAYIERLQAQVVTAEIIESLLVKTSNLEVLNGASIGNFTIENGELKAYYFYQAYIGTTLVHVSGDVRLTSGGVYFTSRYGGTTDHPSVITWGTELTSGGLKVGTMEVRRDGVYRNGTQIL